MTPDEIRKAKSLIAAVGNPEGIYATEVMKLLRLLLADLEAANLKIEAMQPVVDTAKMLINNEKWPYLLGGGHLAHAVDAYQKTQPTYASCENYRADSGEVTSRFCSEFDSPAMAHLPTCQFFRKEGP